MVSGFGCQVTRPFALLLQRPPTLAAVISSRRTAIGALLQLVFLVGFDRYSRLWRLGAMEFLDSLGLLELLKFLEQSLLALLEISERL